MKFTVTTPPVNEPISLAVLRLHMRIDHTDEDELISTYLTAAREWCEDYTRRSLITQTITLEREGFDGTIELPRGPVVSVDSVSYVDADGVTQTLGSEVYEVDIDPIMSCLRLASGQTWPGVGDTAYPVSIVYTAGYGTTSASVPAPIRSALMMTAANLYEFREPIISGTIITKVPFAVESLLASYRVHGEPT